MSTKKRLFKKRCCSEREWCSQIRCPYCKMNFCSVRMELEEHITTCNVFSTLKKLYFKSTLPTTWNRADPHVRGQRLIKQYWVTPDREFVNSSLSFQSLSFIGEKFPDDYDNWAEFLSELVEKSLGDIWLFIQVISVGPTWLLSKKNLICCVLC